MPLNIFFQTEPGGAKRTRVCMGRLGSFTLAERLVELLFECTKACFCFIPAPLFRLESIGCSSDNTFSNPSYRT